MTRNPFPNFDPLAKRRAVEGLPPLAETAALRHTRCCNNDFSENPQTTSSTSNQTDARVTATDNANLINLDNANFTARGGDEGGNGGVINFTTNDPAVASHAISAISDLAQKTGTSITAAAKALADGSNKIAADVAKSQESFVETASGQKNVVYVMVAGIALLVLVPRLFKK